MQSKSHNITLATLFGESKPATYGGETGHVEYTGLQVDFDTLVKNVVDTFTVNGNVIGVNGSSISVILPNVAVIGVDDATGNWIINGALTDARARGIDGTVSFDELSAEQRRELGFAEVTVETLPPGADATAEIIDRTISQDGVVGDGEMDALYRVLSLGIPRGDRGDVMFATFDIDKDGMLYMNVSEDYHGVTFSIRENGYLEFNTDRLGV